ncbi:DUF7002 family protein [Microterricola pindariensis]|uniref:DUF7002 family protein n=1 Tax=Microterricola pindariensis TaxID=478010 RepID=UPI001930EBE7|nr:hypothetical protein [Microterricola pindariensis]
MQTSEFVRLYPELFHMAADGAWPSIQAHGLLSASALVERWGVSSDAARRSLLSERRAESQPIEHPELGTVVLRDQKPIHEPSLADSLDGLSVSEWYETLNSRVFFFPQRRRMLELLSARSYRNDVHTVVTIDTAALMAAYERDIELCAINSGFAQPHAKARRGTSTFLPIADYQHPSRAEQRPNGNDVAELTVRGAVPDVARFVTRVERMQDGVLIEQLYSATPTTRESEVDADRRVALGAIDLGSQSTRELLRLYSGVLGELAERSVIRTLNAPAGDLAETLVATAYTGALAPNSEKSWDVSTGDGRLLQVKSRVVKASAIRKPIQFSVFRSWTFDAAVFVVFAAESYDVLAGIEVPAASVEAKALATGWVGGSRLTVSLAVLRALPGAVDRTFELQRAYERIDVAGATG